VPSKCCLCQYLCEHICDLLVHQALPFTRASLSWTNVHYNVFVNTDKVKTKKVLLNGVSGAAPPGRLVALMGATGGECGSSRVVATVLYFLSHHLS
jgi:hypothetical protein